MDYDLERFVRAQNGEEIGSTYKVALDEIRHGRKMSHWMWYIFPRLEGLGRSDLAKKYAIHGLEEAKAYLDHPVLGPRLIEISSALLELERKNPKIVMGPLDCINLRSSMTLFAHVDGSDPVFRKVLEGYYDGEEDEKTLALLF